VDKEADLKFEIHQDAETGKYWVRLADDDDRPLAHSHFHIAKSEAEQAVQVLKAEAGTAPVIDLTNEAS
jgi:uncharacterized protein YegP (UPF0339 family)